MNDELIDAINDLARILIAFNMSGSKADAVRRLFGAGIKQSRIAFLLGLEIKEVTSIIAKMRKNEKKGGQ